MDWDLYRYFIAVAQTGSLSAAAARIKVSQPTVGRKISELEGLLGYPLFLRSPRGLLLTQEGQRIFACVHKMEFVENELNHIINQYNANDAGVVHLSASEGVSMHWVMRWIPGFLDSNRNIHITLNVSNSFVDFTRGGSDIALRAGEKGPNNLYSRKIADMKFGLYASKDYFDRHSYPETLEELYSHRVVGAIGNLISFLPADWMQSLSKGCAAPFSSNSLISNLIAAEQGIGISLVACIVAQRSSGLRRVLHGLDTPSLPLWIMTHPDTRKLDRVKKLTQFIAAQARHDAAAFAGLE